jgi:gas vesicle protein
MIMISHLMKGYTLGYLLTRRLGRAITGIPGFLIDALIVAPLCVPGTGSYLEYWSKTSTYYIDNTKQPGIFQGITGWVGDLIGTVLGAAIGTILGGVLYIPDAILRTLAFAYEKICEGCNNFANLVGTRELFKTLTIIESPRTYTSKAWNISVGSLGLLLAAPLNFVARIVEAFLPLGNGISNSLWNTGGFVGGLIGWSVSLLAFPAVHVCSKAVSLFRDFRESVRSFSAYIYAKTNAHLQSAADYEFSPHSEIFRNKITEYKAKSTTEVIFGKLRLQRQQRQQVVPVHVYEDMQYNSDLQHVQVQPHHHHVNPYGHQPPPPYFASAPAGPNANNRVIIEEVIEGWPGNRYQANS